MQSPSPLQLIQQDPLNDEIWQYLHTQNTDALHLLNEEQYALDLIQQEIDTGCSPCPDILSADFGNQPSVMFVSTVYGLIHKYLQKEYPRQQESWQTFTADFYQSVIRKKIGIYGRQLDIYHKIAEKCGYIPEFCFTELVKTVLMNANHEVSGLEQPSFTQYFFENEAGFLRKRLQAIQKKCVVFPCSELTTFFTLAALAGVESPIGLQQLPTQIEYVYLEHEKTENIVFSSRVKRGGRIEALCKTQSGSFSKTLAFRSIFKIKDKEIYIVPLPHPSNSNNTYWKKNFVDQQITTIVQKLF